MSDEGHEPAWLDEDEQETWRLLVTILHVLPGRLDATLRDHDLRFFDYLLLAMLSEVEGHSLPMQRLAEVTDASLSRLSHAVSRLEDRGLVSRCRDEHDRRVNVASLTPAGMDLLVAAAPDHVASVRAAVFDALDHDQVLALRPILRDVVARLAPGITPGVDSAV
jgi:DNA-binding MarR family transcriptional regulator